MAASLWRRLGCCLTGHDYSIASDDARMFVRCNSCGHTSRGLEIDRTCSAGRPATGGPVLAATARRRQLRLATR